MLTPHPGEMARLAGITVAEVQANRLEVARSFAQRIGVTLVLKGARTLIAHPDGRVAVNTTGNPGMAKGGSGDLLTGLIAGLLAQYPDDAGARRRGGGLFARAGRGPGRARGRRAHACWPPIRLAYLARAFRYARDRVAGAAGTGMFGCRGHCMQRTKGACSGRRAHAAD